MRDVTRENRGCNIESQGANGTGRPRFLEVKGRIGGVETATVTKNETLTAFSKLEE